MQTKMEEKINKLKTELAEHFIFTEKNLKDIEDCSFEED